MKDWRRSLPSSACSKQRDHLQELGGAVYRVTPLTCKRVATPTSSLTDGIQGLSLEIRLLGAFVALLQLRNDARVQPETYLTKMNHMGLARFRCSAKHPHITQPYSVSSSRGLTTLTPDP